MRYLIWRQHIGLRAEMKNTTRQKSQSKRIIFRIPDRKEEFHESFYAQFWNKGWRNVCGVSFLIWGFFQVSLVFILAQNSTRLLVSGVLPSVKLQAQRLFQRSIILVFQFKSQGQTLLKDYREQMVAQTIYEQRSNSLMSLKCATCDIVIFLPISSYFYINIYLDRRVILETSHNSQFLLIFWRYANNFIPEKNESTLCDLLKWISTDWWDLWMASPDSSSFFEESNLGG